MSIETKMIQLVNNLLEEKNINAVATSTETRMDFLGLERYDLVKLDFDIDLTFNITTVMSEISNCKTVGDLVEIVKKELELNRRLKNVK